jgi:hypothetical protein
VVKRRGKPMPVIPRHVPIRYQALGQLRAEGLSRQACEAGVRIRACMLDADAVILEDAIEAHWANEAFSAETRRTLERHRRIRSAIGSPLGVVSRFVRRLTGWTGQVGEDEAATERLSAIAVRAVNRGQRLALATSGVRLQVAKVGTWMLIAVVAWFFLASVWPLEGLQTGTSVFSWRRPSAGPGGRDMAIAYLIPSIFQRGAGWLLVTWPLVMALALRVRKSGRALVKSAVTFATWGTLRGAYLIFGGAAGRLVLGRTWIGYAMHLAFACALVVIGFAAWRVSRRFVCLVDSDGTSQLSRLDLGAWLFTLLFVVVSAGTLIGVFAR